MSVSHFPTLFDALHGAFHHAGSSDGQSPRAVQATGRLKKPAVGMRLTFVAAACAELAGIPAEVTYIWPRFRSGDYLVTLEYAEPVKLGKALIRHIDAFVSEMEPPAPERDRPMAVASLCNHRSGPRHVSARQQ
jgi:hypothetical protein